VDSPMILKSRVACLLHPVRTHAAFQRLPGGGDRLPGLDGSQCTYCHHPACAALVFGLFYRSQ
jgi:hypothetical protein